MALDSDTDRFYHSVALNYKHTGRVFYIRPSYQKTST